MPIETVFGNIQFPADKPLCERRLPLEYGVPRFLPHQLVGFARPKFFRLPDRLAVPAAIRRKTDDARVASKFSCRLEKTRLLEVRLDVFFHEGGAHGDASKRALAAQRKVGGLAAGIDDPGRPKSSTRPRSPPPARARFSVCVPDALADFSK